MTIPQSDIDAIRSRVSLRDLIGRDVLLRRAGRDWQGLCPFHQERTPSFHVVEDRGFYHCFGCGAHGDVIGYLMRSRSLDFLSAVRELSNHTTKPQRKGSAETSQEAQDQIGVPPSGGQSREAAKPTRQVAELWAGADAPSIAEFYLASRSIACHALPRVLRGHRSVMYAEAAGTERPIVEPPWRTWRTYDEATRQWTWWKGIHKPAMLAAIVNPEGRVTALQRIWCETRYEVDASRTGPQDARAVGLQIRKKTIGYIGTGAIRLSEPTTTLGLGEGTETSMAAAQLFRFPVWALAGVSRLGFPAHWERVRPHQKPLMWFQRERPDDPEARWIDDRPPAVWIPPEIKRLYIFGDHGDIGEQSADYCAWWHRRNRRIEAEAILPTAGVDDWNTQLLKG